MIATVVVIFLLTALVGAYVALILGLKKLVAVWVGRDVMDLFRPTRADVNRAERELRVR